MTEEQEIPELKMEENKVVLPTLDVPIKFNGEDKIVNVPIWDIDTTHMINRLRVDGATTQTQKEGGSKDGSTGDYWIDRENKKITAQATFPTDTLLKEIRDHL